ncbi:hypothetical protein V1299_003679 [Vibrio cholerae]|nr:enterotoxin A family protein [Vibrio cholerae]EME9827528.1 hypothetical protein [Vibrio cholerae]
MVKIIFVFFIFLSSFSYANDDKLYRADSRAMSNTCDEKTQSLGVKFLDEYQSKVKRQIFSGYQSDIDTHNRIKDEL